MSRFVLDASATLAWCFQDESVDWVDALFRGLGAGDQAIVPRHWALEISNSFLMAVRRGRMKREELDRALQILLALPIQADLIADSVLFEKIPILAEKYALTAYDAAYLELALRERLPLATLDGELGAAASSAGVALAR
jgi:predicted nucleic acid-binding protein